MVSVNLMPAVLIYLWCCTDFLEPLFRASMHTKTEVVKVNLNSRTSRRGEINCFTRSWNWQKDMA
jgi:hypothetical protein